ncbi:MAG: CbiX/SirB N-terminal domain-containing protein [Deltaproteobacteria bacterium]|nr:MAG: CbiX/SirB N-terminal domain-containing protein [Deltaproteobacteria bacterium]
MNKPFYLFIAHGSREPKSNASLFELVENFQKKFGMATVRGAVLELATPLIPEGIDLCVAEGASEIFILPLMIFQGRHVGKDIPALIAEAQEKHASIPLHNLGALADPESQEGFINF